MNEFETWVEAVKARGVVAVDPPMMGDWPELEEDMVSLLQLLEEEGTKACDKVKMLVRVGFGRDTEVEALDNWQYRDVIFNPGNSMVFVDVVEMRIGPYAGKRRVTLALPELEYETIDGCDLGWAIWIRKQMPRCHVSYPRDPPPTPVGVI